MIDILGGDNGAQFTVASACNVLEAHYRLEGPTPGYNIVDLAAAVLHGRTLYCTLIDILGSYNGARFTVASECDVLEAAKKPYKLERSEHRPHSAWNKCHGFLHYWGH